MNEIRINARLDEKSANDLYFLQKELGDASITDAVKYSIEKVAEELRSRTKAKRQKQVWLDSGFVGGFEGSEDFSSNYKECLSEIMDEKFPSLKALLLDMPEIDDCDLLRSKDLGREIER